ncbi:hypothetical protein Gohar_010239 [Gossypium harknessii]|uniref:Uncharacterized protein n=1 Tax=Gossypium harknessii TaxID=34285 RepID=A0A7J9GSJ2_9ROSI|nr:hypothetical protein [Gossypium harknessii]
MGIDHEENSGRGEVVAEVRAIVSSLVELITSQVEQGSVQDGPKVTRKQLDFKDASR